MGFIKTDFGENLVFKNCPKTMGLVLRDTLANKMGS